MGKNCVYCGLLFMPDQNHSEHLCWPHLHSANQAIATWKMERDKYMTEVKKLLEEAEALAKGWENSVVMERLSPLGPTRTISNEDKIQCAAELRAAFDASREN